MTMTRVETFTGVQETRRSCHKTVQENLAGRAELGNGVESSLCGVRGCRVGITAIITYKITYGS